MSQAQDCIIPLDVSTEGPRGWRATVRRLGPAGLIAGASAVMPALGGLVLLGALTALAPQMRADPAAYVLLYIVGFAVCCGLAIMPTYAVSILGGWVFGFALGFPAAMLVFVGASAIGYAVGALTSRQRVVEAIQTHPRWALVHRELLNGSNLKTLGLVTLLRLPPTMPFAMSNIAFAAAAVPLGIYLLATLIGLAPRSAMMVFFAAGMQNLAYDTGEGRWVWLAGIVLTLIVVWIITRLANRALARIGGVETT